jgi:hypothetical protein
MAVEVRRGCGYRKVGGTYIMGGKLGAPCCRFPIILDVCPCCGGGIRLTRTWTWVDPRPWLASPCTAGGINPASPCPVATLTGRSELGERVGLINIGAGFYRNTDEFRQEASVLGISRRVQAIPRNFRLGETWVFLAHPRVKQVAATKYRVLGTRGKVLRVCDTHEEASDFTAGEGLTGATTSIVEAQVTEWKGGIFALFKPTAIERLYTQSQFQALSQEERSKLERQQVTPVIVPDDDRDHQGSVYDSEEDEAELELETT